MSETETETAAREFQRKDCPHYAGSTGPYRQCVTCLAAELAAAEERGRRRGVEEHKALKSAHEYCLHMFAREWLINPRNRSIFAAQIFYILDAALAPRDSGPVCVDRTACLS